ncbi:PaaI family thioesterase [Streptomyces sp. NPDC048644]|uniref:PaaI family thioesterase n=1 Tax=Streptomyces sp. NPDC048644 TaxID=3365582 RepID=UPI00371FEC7E
MTRQTHPLDALLGIRYEELSAKRVITSLALSPRIHGPAGAVHGGVLAALVESAVSAGGALNVDEGRSAVCAETQMHHMRSAVSGTLHACAVPVHCGFTQQLWSAEVFDERNRLVSCATVQLLNVPDHGGPAQETVPDPME